MAFYHSRNKSLAPNPRFPSQFLYKQEAQLGKLQNNYVFSKSKKKKKPSEEIETISPCSFAGGTPSVSCLPACGHALHTGGFPGTRPLRHPPAPICQGVTQGNKGPEPLWQETRCQPACLCLPKGGMLAGCEWGAGTIAGRGPFVLHSRLSGAFPSLPPLGLSPSDF